ncbi:MAG TPA: GTPase [Pirellulales bacterium]|nr:GTPase [Pirellulales bacterium]
MFSCDETIAAVASAAGGAARGIVRLSGPGVRACLDRCFQPADPQGWAAVARPTVFPGFLTLAGSGARLPCDVYLWPGTRSYTRQPVAEVQTLGSPPLLEAVLTTLAACGARPARPGEFTLRAFLAGRLDLTQAEAVLGVIDAADSRQLADALEQLAGGLAGPLHALRGQLLDLLAHLEAGLDFADEGVQFITPEALMTELTQAAGQVAALVQRMTGRAHVGETARVVLVGAPNVGKSTLFNALAGRDAALVSPLAGTTRDYLVAPLELAGLRCDLIDTAGHDPSTGDEISAAAGHAAARQLGQADIQIFCLDVTRPLTDWERERLSVPPAATRLVVWTKADAADPQRILNWEGEAPAEPAAAPDGSRLPARQEPRPPEKRGRESFINRLPSPFYEPLRISALKGTGLDCLRGRLRGVLAELQSPECRVVAGTAARSRASLAAAAEALAEAQTLASTAAGEELVAAELRLALQALGEVVGAVYTDDVLDRIFSRFCIGK